MKKNIVIKTLLIVFTIALIVSAIQLSVYSVGTSDAISAMNKMQGSDVKDDTGVLKPMLNSVIGLIQVAGTGVAMIMVTIFGIKYIVAAPNDKADVKKQIAPMVIGAIILFASVNLVALVADTADSILSKAAS